MSFNYQDLQKTVWHLVPLLEFNHDEARLPAGRAEPDPQDQEGPRPLLAAGVFHLRRVPRVRHGGQNDPNGDEKFLALSREPRCIPIVATQSISSLHDALPGETWRTVLQSFRTKIFLTQTDGFSAKTASELCGKEDQWKVNYNISESGHDARVSLWTGKSVAHKANVTTSKSYNTQSDFRFDTKTFTELKNAQTITLAYDGLQPPAPDADVPEAVLPDVNKSYFRQLEDGEL